MMGSYILEAAAVFCILIAIIYLKLRNKFQYFAKRGIPYLEPETPLFGSWRAVLIMENLVDSLDRIYKKDDSKIFGFFYGTMPSVMVTDPDLIGEVMIKKFSHFNDRGSSSNPDINPLDNHLVNLEGPMWRTMRNKLSPTFTTGKLKGMLSLMEESVDSFLDTIESGKDREMKETFGRLAIHIVGSCAFGIESDALKNDNSLFLSYCGKMSKPGIFLFIRTILNFAYPRFSKLVGIRTWSKEMTNFFLGLVRNGFDLRKNKEFARNDFLQLLWQLKEKGEIDAEEYYDEEDVQEEIVDEHEKDDKKIVFNEVLLTAQAFSFFAAGYETTSTCLGFVCYLLAKNPKAQEKAREEIRNVKKKYGSFTYKALKELDYLEACINETLRVFPPAGAASRICTKPVNIGGYDLDKGTMVFIPINSLHNDPKYFTDAEKFQPERFLVPEHHPLVFMPFGVGPRSCIGKRFAILEMKISLAKLLDKFSAEPSPKMTSEPLKLVPLSFVSVPEGGINCILRKLED